MKQQFNMNVDMLRHLKTNQIPYLYQDTYKTQNKFKVPFYRLFNS